ncbi:hypothetical protein V8Z74_19505 [Comamonas sp. w2-DMI]|uniref:hypothetical protein n=1 Tax=Comamonas sp. w2-DMI TaxID=3126391 RepID=UPI0032E4B98F
MNEEKLEKALLALECESQITRILLGELIAQSPNPEELLQRFQRAIDEMSVARPHDVDLEQVVELRARADQTAQLVRQRLKASSATR